MMWAMRTDSLLFVVLVLGFWAFLFAERKATLRGVNRHPYSLPIYSGMYFSFAGLIPSALCLLIAANLSEAVLQIKARALLAAAGLTIDDLSLQKVLLSGELSQSALSPSLQSISLELARWREWLRLSTTVVVLITMSCALMRAWRRWSRGLNARLRVEQISHYLLVFCTAIAVVITVGIVVSVLWESVRFFSFVSVAEFLFSVDWRPESLENAAFGVLPLLVGSFLIALIALFVAVPVGLMVAVYINEYASRPARLLVRPLIEVLAGVPTVVYGFVAVLVVAPVLQSVAAHLGWDTAGESAAAAGLVLGVMIIPFVSSLSTDVMAAVPRSLREASLALGATPSETVLRVVLPAAMPGILASLLLAASRAIGETMIVVMAAGLVAKITLNPLDSVTTLTAQIVTLLTGDQAFDSPQTLAAFALGLVLLVFTLVMNIVGLVVTKRYRERVLRVA